MQLHFPACEVGHDSKHSSESKRGTLPVEYRCFFDRAIHLCFALNERFIQKVHHDVHAPMFALLIWRGEQNIATFVVLFVPKGHGHGI